MASEILKPYKNDCTHWGITGSRGHPYSTYQDAIRVQNVQLK